MDMTLIVLGGIVIFCIGFLIGMSLGKMDGTIIYMNRWYVWGLYNLV